MKKLKILKILLNKLLIMRYYLDYNASAPILKEVKDYLISTLDIVGNPSSIHHAGREAKKVIEKSREQISSFIKKKK